MDEEQLPSFQNYCSLIPLLRNRPESTLFWRKPTYTKTRPKREIIATHYSYTTEHTWSRRSIRHSQALPQLNTGSDFEIASRPAQSPPMSVDSSGAEASYSLTRRGLWRTNVSTMPEYLIDETRMFKVPKIRPYGDSGVSFFPSTRCHVEGQVPRKADGFRWVDLVCPVKKPDWRFSMESKVFTNEMRTLIKDELLKFHTRNQINHFSHTISSLWLGMDRYNLTVADPQDSKRWFEAKSLTSRCNKLTALYWTGCGISNQEMHNNIPQIYEEPSSNKKFSQHISRHIFQQWFNLHGHSLPDMRFDHFFASPFRIDTNGPQTISDIVSYHVSECAVIQNCLEILQAGQCPRDRWSDRPRRLAGTLWPDPHNHKVLPMSRAIILIVDSIEYSSEQTVLLVKTGHEEHMNAAIDLEQLRGFALPLVRDDANRDGLTTIRVPLTIAMRFVFNIYDKELAAGAKPAIQPAPHDPSREPAWRLYSNYTANPDLPRFAADAGSSGEWAERILQHPTFLETHQLPLMGDACGERYTVPPWPEDKRVPPNPRVGFRFREIQPLPTMFE